MPYQTPPDVERRVLDLLGQNLSVREVERRLGVPRTTVHRIALRYADGVPPTKPKGAPAPRLPDPAPEAGGPRLPDPLIRPLNHLHIDTPGWWLVLGDTHFPMHDKGTIEAAFREAREKGAVGVLLNGDMMDMFSVSPFFREPTKHGMLEELECGRQALAWMRGQLPRARFVMREGNHDFRLRRYIVERAGALYELPELRLPNLLGLPDLGIEWVQDKAKIFLGKLITLHGHELRKGEGVNPARHAFLRTTATVLVNHHHRTSEHHQRGLDDKHFAAWSVGCACYTSADYDPYNQWNHGFAMVRVESDGWFSVLNRRVLNGRVV